MTNFHDPARVAQDFLAAMKLWHTMNGLYIWEFFITLDYEWSVIRGHRPYRWTIWVYSFTRLTALLSVIASMIGFDMTSPTNCQAWATTTTVLGFLAFAAASLLIVLRTIAIWNRNKLVIIITMSAWLTYVSFLIEGMVRIRAVWEPLQGSCAVLNLKSSKPAILATLASDMILLLIMLIGLLRWRIGGGGTFGVARLLWTQGIIWLLMATIAEVPSSVFICLNLNDPFDLMFQSPSTVVMTIAATRMYRVLTDFASRDILPQDGLQSGPIVFEAKKIPIVPFSPNRVEVGVYTTSEQYPTSQASHDGVYIIGTEGQLNDKPHGLGDDIESGGGEMRIVMETAVSQTSFPSSEDGYFAERERAQKTTV